MTCLDLATILQYRSVAAPRPGKAAPETLPRRQATDLNFYIATSTKVTAEADLWSEAKAKVAALEQSLGDREVACEKWRDQAEAAAKLVETLQRENATLKNDLTEAVAMGERRRREAEAAARRADDLLAELYELTCEHVETLASRQRGF